MRNTNAPIWGAQAATRIKQPASLITGFVPPQRHGTNGGEGGRWAVYRAARWDHGRCYSRILVLPAQLNQNTLDQPRWVLGTSQLVRLGDQLANQISQLNNSLLGNHLKSARCDFLCRNLLNESKIHENAIRTCSEHSSVISTF